MERPIYTDSCLAPLQTCYHLSLRIYVQKTLTTARNRMSQRVSYMNIVHLYSAVEFIDLWQSMWTELSPLDGERKYIYVGQDIITLAIMGLVPHSCESSCCQRLHFTLLLLLFCLTLVLCYISHYICFCLFYRMKNMKFLLLIVCIAMATAKKDWRRLKRINNGLRKYQLS